MPYHNNENTQIVISGGDPGGINYEILLKSLIQAKDSYWVSQLVLFLSKKALLYWQDFYSLKLPEPIYKQCVFIEDLDPSLNFDFKVAEVSAFNGEVSLKCLNFATDYVLKNTQSRVLLTMPIHKKAISLTGMPHFQGHTEYLADLTHTKKVTMVLANEFIASALVTTHLPLKDVAAHINPEIIKETCDQFYHFAKHRQENTHLYVCALNPHSGDEGLLGKEEIEIINPAVQSLQKRMPISGPYAADTLFIKALEKDKPHFFVAMYHDQGIIPVKILSPSSTVNITLGLPFFRISVGHGTGFDIAKQNKARIESFFTAIKWIFSR